MSSNMSVLKIEDLKTIFNPSTLLPGEQANIATLCRNFQIAHSDLHSSTEATVNSAPGPHGRLWWHKNDYDKTDHITVRYNRRKGGDRVHIYRDGSGKMNPQKPPKKNSTAQVAETGEFNDSDCTVEYSDEEEEVQI